MPVNSTSPPKDILSYAELRDMSFQLRTSLTCIMGLASLFEKDNLTERQLKTLSSIQTHGGDALKVFDQLGNKMREQIVYYKARSL